MKKGLIKRLLVLLLGLGIIFALGSCVLSVPTTITLFNTSGTYTVITFKVSSHSSSSWGGDLLGASTLGPMSSRSFSVNSGYNDAQITTNNGSYPTITLMDFYTSTDGSTTLVFSGSSLY
jgi:hypothetical protein